MDKNLSQHKKEDQTQTTDSSIRLENVASIAPNTNSSNSGSSELAIFDDRRNRYKNKKTQQLLQLHN